MAEPKQPGPAAPEGVPDPGDRPSAAAADQRRHDPGDAVPEGVAPDDPPPLGKEDRKVLRQLESLPERRRRRD